MAKGMSVHIGLNQVDTAKGAYWSGWDSALFACESDARDMLALAKSQGFNSSKLLLTKAATARAVIRAISDAAARIEAGDLFLLTYSGHGGQVNDTNGDETESDRMDETWCCYDRMLIDDELYELWRKFKKGARIVVLSDSCHSGTVTRDVPMRLAVGRRVRAMPTRVVRETQMAHAKLYKRIQDGIPAAETGKVQASVVLISGCMDNQTSLDGDQNGLFTEVLKSVWDGGRFKGSYKRFRDRIVVRMPPKQTPNYYRIGAANPEFEAQKPFTI